MRKLIGNFGVVAAGLIATPAFAQEHVPTVVAAVIPSTPKLVAAIIAVVVAFVVVWFGARNSTLLRDNLLPQIEPRRQPYSLARWQMAIWFSLIFTAFIAIFIMTGQYNDVVRSQELWLMGISATSGVASVAVDVIKDSPADAANRGLQALGITTYSDVLRIKQEIQDRKEQLKAGPAANIVQQLTLAIRDRELLLTAYENAIKPFVSEGWYKDVTTDLNGAALHRVQTVMWTLALGVVFAFEVMINHTMPQFDTALLLLLGVSNAGYVGFKYPEPQQ